MSNDWSRGYVADMPYSCGYYHELAPPFLRFYLLMNGFGNASQGEPYTYCELGYGQGISCNVHAAANPRGRFFGTDFNPDHALFAQGLARQAGLSADWRASGFEQLLEEDIPPLDVVTLHGVWSWIDPATRSAVVEFLRRRLKIGGAVFLSYNVMPGWSAEKPLRDLLHMHTELAGASGATTGAKIQAALRFGEGLRQGKAAFFERNAPAGQMMDDMARDDLHVVAHEYFNRSWHISYFSEVAQALGDAGLNFACSLHRSDLTGEVFHRTQSFEFEGLPVALRQTANDFVLNRRFRRDVFLRGSVKLPRREREQMLRQVELVLLRPASLISAVQATPYGQVTLDASITRRIASALDSCGGRASIDEVIDKGDLRSTPVERVFEIIAALVAQSEMAPVFADDAAAAKDARAAAMNRAICERARYDDQVRHLCSPVTGRAVEATQTERLLLLAWLDGARRGAELCAAVQALQAVPNGPDAAAPGEELTAQAQRFAELTVPLWQRLGIVEGSAA